MTHTKFNSRSIQAQIAALLICLSFGGKAYAQILVQPSYPDSYWYSSAGSAYPIQRVNTAMIAYGSSFSPQYLFTSVYYDASGTEQIQINDPFIGSPISVTQWGLLLASRT